MAASWFFVGLILACILILAPELVGLIHLVHSVNASLAQ